MDGSVGWSGCVGGCFPNGLSRSRSSGSNGAKIRTGKSHLYPLSHVVSAVLDKAHLNACFKPRHAANQAPTTIQLSVRRPVRQASTSTACRKKPMGLANRTSSRRMGAGNEATRS